jgi:hypothetical protein
MTDFNLLYINTVPSYFISINPTYFFSIYFILLTPIDHFYLSYRIMQPNLTLYYFTLFYFILFNDTTTVVTYHNDYQ